MFFLNYNEINLNFVYRSSLRFIILKQNNKIKNSFILKLPKIQFYFIIKKIIELNSLKLFNNIIFLWLMTNNKLFLKKFKVNLDKGVKYNSFLLINQLSKNFELFFKFLDFFLNKLTVLLTKSFFKNFNNDNFCIFQLKNLDIFSNIKILNNFYIPKIKDILFFKFILFNYQKKYFNIKYFLNLFKIKIG